MPVNENWWNPYRLLETKTGSRVKARTIEKFSKNTYSGTIQAELTNLSLFFVGENKKDKALFITNNEQIPFVPGTSLKGMIRSLAEYINGDPPVVGVGEYRAESLEQIPITCNMFGILKSKVLRGKISFSDAIGTERLKPGEKKNYMPGSPKKHHKSFYRNEKLHKFYFHQGEYYNPGLKSGLVPNQNNGRQNPINIDAMPPGNTFNFKVYFENLSEAEFNLLLYCLTLEKGLEKTIGKGEQSFKVKGDMAHKLGRAKSYGLGSVRVEIKNIKLLPENPADRYSGYINDNYRIYEGENLEKFLNEKIKIYADDKTPHMENLRKMMIFDPGVEVTFKYPSNDWFKNGINEDGSRKSNDPLKEI